MAQVIKNNLIFKIQTSFVSLFGLRFYLQTVCSPYDSFSWVSLTKRLTVLSELTTTLLESGEGGE